MKIPVDKRLVDNLILCIVFSFISKQHLFIFINLKILFIHLFNGHKVFGIGYVSVRADIKKNKQ